MNALPVILHVRGRHCVVVGAGSVGRRRAAALLAAGADVTVIAPDAPDMAGHAGLAVVGRPYRPGDLEGAFLVVIATDDATVNDAVAAEAAQRGVLVNRADDPAAGDLTIPAHEHHGPITIAVHTGGVSPAAAAAIRRELSDALDADWVTLLETIAPYRSRIQRRFTDPMERRRRLAALTDDAARTALRTGGIEALRRYCEALVA